MRAVRDNWGQIRRLTGDDSGTAERFGNSVALDGETLAVGAPGEAVRGVTGAGVAYIFRRNEGGAGSWGRFDKMIASPVQAGAGFGTVVALGGADLAVSAPDESLGAIPLAGAVYAFRRADDWDNDWALVQRLQPGELATAQHFGTSLSVDHGRVLAGGPLPAAADPSGAAAWLYTRDGAAADSWRLTKKFTTTSSDSLGTAVALDGLHVVVADPTGNVGALADRGAVHAWDLSAAEFVPETAAPEAAGIAASAPPWPCVATFWPQERRRKPVAPRPTPERSTCFSAGAAASGGSCFSASPIRTVPPPTPSSVLP